MKIIVADAGPLIGISRVQHLPLLQQLFGKMMVTTIAVIEGG